MAEVIVAQRMWQRRDTAANWTAKNPILAAGEIGIQLAPVLTDVKFKIGDGSTAWSGLPFFGSGGTIAMRTTTTWIQWSNDGGTTWNNLILIADLKGKDGREVQMRTNSTTRWVQWKYVDETAWRDLFSLDSVKGDKGDTGDAGPPGPSSTTFPTASFDGGLGDIIVGSFCDLYVPFGFEISKVTLVGGTVGILEIDVRVAPYATFPPSSLDTICGGSRPRLLSTIKYQDDALTDWTKTIASGSFIRFIITACTGVKRANLVLEGART